MDFINKIILGDCGEILKEISDNTFNLICTSPPYSNARKKTYGGIAPDKYVEWFLPKSEQFLRTLRPDGTFILNIKENVIEGERSTYVLELILALKKQGWIWTEEYIWHKRCCSPGKWPNRFRDAWERLLQFNKTKKFNMYQEEVMVPRGDWAAKRLEKPSKRDGRRCESNVGSGFGVKRAAWIDRKLVYPTNVLHLASETSNKKHSAAFPKSLPAWFIKLFTQPGDLVLDPFSGSGTTCVMAKEMGRNYTGIENNEECFNACELK